MIWRDEESTREKSHFVEKNMTASINNKKEIIVAMLLSIIEEQEPDFFIDTLKFLKRKMKDNISTVVL